MADRADVVPLRRRDAREFPGPAESFGDVADPARALSVTWSPDSAAVQVSIGTANGVPTTLILDADDVLDLVRALVGGLPEPGQCGPRPWATVLPLSPREVPPSTEDS